MAIKTRDEYLERLKEAKPNVFMLGKKVDRVWDDPLFRSTLNLLGATRDFAFDSELSEPFYLCQGFCVGGFLGCFMSFVSTNPGNEVSRRHASSWHNTCVRNVPAGECHGAPRFKSKRRVCK